MKTKFILLSCGRSGSRVFSSAIGYLMNGASEPYLGEEIFGHNLKQMRKLESFYGANGAAALLQKSFRLQEKQHSQVAVVGVKLKPYVENEMYDDVWRFVKENHVRVIHNRRNGLDVCLSRIKHERYPSLKPHYSASDKMGLKRAREIMGLNVDVPELLRELKTLQQDNEFYEIKIKDLGIPYLSVTYEDLTSGGRIGLYSWKQIVNFLGGVGGDITGDQIEKAMGEYGKTTIKPQSEMILNYDEVVDALTGTVFEKLLNV